ncbi:MAG TPA: hypothetical protein DEA47_04560 [Peptococcaceae bacterium]|nr:MAG: Uncharacterized protein XD50_1594 [Clostridia bacterium 41_269]HBT20618.1 hypothetical protein [Peptococcaceae bacterium]
MIVLNFSHPLTEAHQKQLEQITGREISRVVEIKTQIDPQKPIVQQVVDIADRVGLTAKEWQSLPILINPPSLNIITAVLLAELHGRCGYFPPVVRLRQKEGSIPPEFEVAEVVNLQEVRERAREKRYD